MDPETIGKHIKEIRTWLKQENIRYEGEILTFLKGCKYDVDKTKIKMKNFYEARRTMPDIFTNRDPLRRNIEILLEKGAFYPLPRQHSDGHTLVLVKAGINDPKTIPMSEVFKVGVMSVDLLMEIDPSFTRRGVGVIIDLKGIGLPHAIQMTPSLIWKMVHLWQECYPIKIKSIDFVNAPNNVELVLNMFRRFLKVTLQQRLRIHSKKFETLHEVINPELLPEEYGGTLGPEFDIIQSWKKKMIDFEIWFLTSEASYIC